MQYAYVIFVCECARSLHVLPVHPFWRAIQSSVQVGEVLLTSRSIKQHTSLKWCLFTSLRLPAGVGKDSATTQHHQWKHCAGARSLLSARGHSKLVIGLFLFTFAVSIIIEPNTTKGNIIQEQNKY